MEKGRKDGKEVIRFYLVVLLLAGFNTLSHAELPPVVFNHQSSVDGLPQNSGRVILQDREGFVWIGTEDGLVRFDGSSMRPFRKEHGNKASLSDNYIASLAEDAAGNIWVGTMGGGLNVISPDTLQVTRLPEFSAADFRDIVPDRKRNVLWLAGGDGLYMLDSARFNRYLTERSDQDGTGLIAKVPLPLGDGKEMANQVSGMVLADDQLWLSTRGVGIICYKPQDKAIRWFRSGANGLKDDTFNTIARDRNGNIWAGSQNQGLVRVIRDASQVRFSHYDNSNSGLAVNDVMAIADAKDDALWIGTWQGGLARFNPQTGKAELYRHHLGDEYSIPSDIIMDITRTRDGQVWVGTFDKGICWFTPTSPFHVYRAVPGSGEGLADNLIWSFASDEQGGLWIGSGKGLSRMNPATQQYALPRNLWPADLWEAVRMDDIRAILADGDALWVAARKSGLVRISLSSGRITPIADLLPAGTTLTDTYFRIIVRDSHGFLWFGASKGLNRFNPLTGELRKYMPEPGNRLALPHYRLRSLFEDSRGRMWAGTSNGLMLLDEHGDILKTWQYSAGSGPDQILAGTGAQGIGEDRFGRIWIASNSGLSVYDEKTKRVVMLREKDGLPSNNAYCALSSGDYMWVSTLNGLARIDIRDFTIERYSTFDGLPDNEFNHNAWHRLPDGRLAFGTLSGFLILVPEAMPGPEKKISPPPLKVRTAIDERQGRKVFPPGYQPLIDLDADTKRIAFEYSSISFGRPGDVLYEVKLQGADPEWRKTGTERIASYAGLAPGQYNFQVHASDRHGQWQAYSTPVRFAIARPAWQTPLAVVGYILVLCGMILSLFILYSRRMRRNALYLQAIVAERTGELETSNRQLAEKNSELDRLFGERERLFRVLAHELRTPLSMMMSILESLQPKRKDDSATLAMAYQSGTRIGSLLDHILNLAKKYGTLGEARQSFAIAPALEELLGPFQLQTEQNKQRLLAAIEVNAARVNMQRDIFIMMVSNLLANACKYTPEGGEICISATTGDSLCRIEVADNGVGIPAGEEQRIFEWFGRCGLQADHSGWGIGLAFVKEGVEAAGGTIQYVPRQAAGALFVMTLPLDDRSEREFDAWTPRPPAGEQAPGHSPLPEQQQPRTILIIEDDPALLAHLPTLFPGDWTIHTTSDAESGWDIAEEREPELIITDLILPGQSGFDLTRRLKADDRTAHIPIIILTALADEENKLAGLGLSVDSFMGKPFSNRELLLRVTGLLANRDRVLANAGRLILNIDSQNTDRAEAGSSKIEDEFLQKLHKVLDDREKISSISLEDIAGELAMSTRSFQREMERLGISWREYKKLRRLRYAMDLLRDPDNKIGVIAENAGYSSAAHFSKVFKKHTGSSPSDWRREH